MNMNNYPNWIFKYKNGQPFAFGNIRCIDGFKVAARVGWDGVIIFGKNSLSPNLYYMNPIEFASLEDFQGSKGEGFKSFEVGVVKLDGSHWFADCIYEPGLVKEDYMDLKSLLISFYQDYKQKFSPPTRKQLERIQRMKDLRGEQFIKDYFYSKCPSGDFNQLTKESAQKIITGLQWIEPRKPISNIFVNPEWIS